MRKVKEEPLEERLQKVLKEFGFRLSLEVPGYWINAPYIVDLSGLRIEGDDSSGELVVIFEEVKDDIDSVLFSGLVKSEEFLEELLISVSYEGLKKGILMKVKLDDGKIISVKNCLTIFMRDTKEVRYSGYYNGVRIEFPESRIVNE